MKVTRSYWLGLGSGLVLSAMLTLVISPHQEKVVTPQATASVPIVKQQVAPQTLVEDTKQVDPPLSIQPFQSKSSNSQSSTQIEQSFSIPNGASSERIADLLFTQGFIKDKASFLATAHQMGIESKFKAGTFILSQSLTSEELINRLLK